MNEIAWMAIFITPTLSVILVKLSQYTLPPQSSPQKQLAVSPSYNQSKAQMDHPQKIS